MGWALFCKSEIEQEVDKILACQGAYIFNGERQAINEENKICGTLGGNKYE